MYRFWALVLFLVIALIVIVLIAGIYNAVIASDMPGWLKYMILK